MNFFRPEEWRVRSIALLRPVVPLDRRSHRADAAHQRDWDELQRYADKRFSRPLSVQPDDAPISVFRVH